MGWVRAALWTKRGDHCLELIAPVVAPGEAGEIASGMVGAELAKSRTPLQKWFYAMYLFTTTRHGVAAKELQRQLGVTYKTAWRMGHELRDKSR